MIVTARCDLVRQKQSIVNYLPVIPIHAWIESDLCALVSDAVLKSEPKKLENLLKQHGVSEERLKTFGFEKVIEKEVKEKARNQLRVVQNKILLATKILSGVASPDERKEIVNLENKIAASLITNLVKQLLPEYYFINCVDICSPQAIGYAVLLRRMRTVPTDLIEEINDGIEAEGGDAYNRDPLSIPQGSLCMFTGVLRSPDLEHLLQNFTTLYTRIGLEDQKPEISENIIQVI